MQVNLKALQAALSVPIISEWSACVYQADMHAGWDYGAGVTKLERDERLWCGRYVKN